MQSPGKIDSTGVILVLVAAIAFSAKAIFVKLAYDDPTVLKNAVDPITLLMLRMIFALPFFAAIAWWSARGQQALSNSDWRAVVVLGLMGYYWRACSISGGCNTSALHLSD